MIAVADGGSIARAAATVGVEESTISRALRRIEDLLGLSVFERGSAGVRLTNAGAAFLERARAITELIETAIAEAHLAARGTTGLVNVGLASAIAPTVVLDVLTPHQAQNESVELRPLEGPPEELLSQLYARSLDIAFVVGALADAPVDRLRLWTERLYLALPDELAPELEVAHWRDLQRAPLLCSRWRGWADLGKFLSDREIGPIQFVPLACNQDTILAYVAAGAGLTVVADTTVKIPRPGVRFVPLDDERATVPVCAAWLPENDNPALRRLVSALRASRPEGLADVQRT